MTGNQKILQVALTRCDSTAFDWCPTDDDFKNYLSVHKPQIMLFTNERVFYNNNDSRNAVVNLAVLKMIPF